MMERQRDLMPYLGSEGMVSLILSGKRGITADKIIPLAKFLGIPPTSLLPWNENGRLKGLTWS